MLTYTDTNEWTSEDGTRWVWNGSKTVNAYSSRYPDVPDDVLTFMARPTRAQVEAAIGRRLRGE